MNGKSQCLLNIILLLFVCDIILQRILSTFFPNLKVTDLKYLIGTKFLRLFKQPPDKINRMQNQIYLRQNGVYSAFEKCLGCFILL